MRLFLTYILPLLLPFVFYFLWAWLVRGRGEGNSHPLTKGPWFWLVLVGFALLAASLGLAAYLGGGGVDTHYTPPHVENGRIVPGSIE